MVKPSWNLREQAKWWMVALAMADRRSSFLPSVHSHAMEGWTDEAGGSTSHVGAGLGGLVPPFRYFYLPWPQWLNRRRLTLPLLHGQPGETGCLLKSQLFLRGLWTFTGRVTTPSVYTSTIAKALYEVAEAIGAKVTVENVERCSDPGSYTADMVRSGYLLTMMLIMITPG